ncbi:MAG: pilus assembly protein PilM [Candidatus Marinimicrobia bacterium]|nr:pilus assembly protein PilM [Candidatus Neomarinimicrobiota bacterium]
MLKSDRILALDIGASGLKLAEYAPLRGGGIELVKFSVQSLGMEQQGDADRSAYIVTTLREMLREEQIAPGPVLCSVSGQSVFSRFVKLPPVASDKVYQIIQYEAQQNVPFPIEEVVWDYQLIGGQAGELDVMLAAIKADLIEELTDCVQAVGLSPELVDVAPMALYNAVRYNYEELRACTLLVDIGARSTDLIFIEAGRLFIRSIPVAGNAITQQIMREFELSFADAEDLKKKHAFVSFGGAYEDPGSEVAAKVSKSVRSVMTRMHAEINRSISFYRSQQAGGRPTALLLAGGSSVIPYTDSFLKEKLKVDVDYLNPFHNVPVNERIAGEDVGAVAHQLGETVGLALRRVLSCPIEINLMPKKVLAEKTMRRRQPYFVLTALVVALLAGVWAAYLNRSASLARARWTEVDQLARGLEQAQQALSRTTQESQGFATRFDHLEQLSTFRTAWLDLLAAIHGAMPEGVWLSGITVVYAQGLNRDTASAVSELELTGHGYIDKVANAQPIRAFRDRLRELDWFSAETEIRLMPTPGPDDFARDFTLRVVLEKPLPL